MSGRFGTAGGALTSTSIPYYEAWSLSSKRSGQVGATQSEIGSRVGASIPNKCFPLKRMSLFAVGKEKSCFVDVFDQAILGHTDYAKQEKQKQISFCLSSTHSPFLLALCLLSRSTKQRVVRGVRLKVRSKQIERRERGEELSSRKCTTTCAMHSKRLKSHLSTDLFSF